MAVVKNGTLWYYEWKLYGKKIRRSTGLRIAEVPKEEVLKLEPEVKKKELQEVLKTLPREVTRPNPTLLDALERYYNEHWSQNRDGLKSYKQVKTLAKIIGNKKLRDITSDDLAQAQGQLIAAGKKPSTVNRYTAAILALLNHAYSIWEVIDRVPKVVRYDESESIRVRVVSWEEEAKILAACNRICDHDMMDLYVVLVDTGMRLSEALTMSYERNIDFDQNTIVIYMTNSKSKRSRQIPMSKRAREVLTRRKERLDLPRPFSPPFSSDTALDRFRRALDAAGLSPEGDIVLHTLRHTFTSRLANAGVDIFQVSKLLGHASVTTTEKRYAHMFVDTLRAPIRTLDQAVEHGRTHSPGSL